MGLYEQPFQTTLFLAALCTQAKFWKSLATFNFQGCNSLKQRKKQNSIHTVKETRSFKWQGHLPLTSSTPHTLSEDRGLQKWLQYQLLSQKFSFVQLKALNQIILHSLQ